MSSSSIRLCSCLLRHMHTASHARDVGASYRIRCAGRVPLSNAPANLFFAVRAAIVLSLLSVRSCLVALDVIDRCGVSMGTVTAAR